ncbi:hypothetical protein J7T55_004520 [Diaporthe amygdali]|uniref:uncharacterized protein n=1 Tax=Phomopsis amygdali TaxID=1214568 RepID=UPI0022FF07AF|nr:uncharacterized protein J7T55_004520 [Diaporthe amygdali]KAJ0114779.1 hypothetical protein J7T55_004520 [Diaporthe amygdali]
MLQAAFLFVIMASASSVPSPENLGLVVARFKESLEPWAPVANNTYLYSKGGIEQENDTVSHDLFRRYTNLPNVGREGQTYLIHIVNNYNSLEDIMIFTQASPFDLTGPVVNNVDEMVAAALQVPIDDATPFNKQKLFRDEDDWEEINWTAAEEKPWITENQLKTLVRANYTPAEFWQFVLEEEHPPAIRAMHGGIFAVRRETIQCRPVEVYERALQRFEEANATNPEVGFYWERMWAPVFSKRYWTYHPINESTNPFRR